jgi:hypothetical protein
LNNINAQSIYYEYLNTNKTLLEADFAGKVKSYYLYTDTFEFYEFIYYYLENGNKNKCNYLTFVLSDSAINKCNLDLLSAFKMYPISIVPTYSSLGQFEIIQYSENVKKKGINLGAIENDSIDFYKISENEFILINRIKIIAEAYKIYDSKIESCFYPFLKSDKKIQFTQILPLKIINRIQCKEQLFSNTKVRMIFSNCIYTYD